MKKTKLILVGNGMAGVRTLEELLKLAPDLYDITVYGAEPHGNYNRILLSPVLAGEMKLPEIMLNDLDWYKSHGIALHTGKKIVRIDRPRRTVVADDGSEERYDRLLLATGSTPVMLPIPGHDLPGVLAYRDIADTEAMIAAAKRGGRAVVIGAGLLGLEAANGLKARGMEVTVVHLAPWIMERQLDKTAADMLQASLEARGLKFLLEKQTVELAKGPKKSGGRVSAVRFADGSEIAAELVVMAIGIRPNTRLAEEAGLHCSRGIVVNDTMQTYDPRIYAVGECVAHRGTAYGLVAPLFEQGKVAANHLAEFGIARYSGSAVSTKLKVTGIDVFSAGDFIGGATDDEIVLADKRGGIYKKLVLRDNRIVGAVLYGDTVDSNWYFQLMKEKKCVGPIRDRLMLGQSHTGGAGHEGKNRAAELPDDFEVCGCNGIKKITIVRAIKEKGLFTLDEVRKHTKASSSCGSCTGLVEQILASAVGGAYQPVAAEKKPMCGCTDYTHEEVRKAVKDNRLLSIPEAMRFLEWRTPTGCPSCRQALNYYLLCAWPREYQDDAQSRFINERVHANIQKDGSFSVVPRIYGGVTSPAELKRIAEVAEKYAVPTVKFTGGQRIDLLGVKKEDLPAIWRDLGHAFGLRLLEGPAHGEDLRRLGMVPLRRAGLDQHGHRPGARPGAAVDAAQDQARRLRLPEELRRGDHQGRRRDRRRLRLGDLRRRQWRHQDRGGAVPLQGEDARGSAGDHRRLHPALPRGSALPRPHGALGRPRRPRLCEAAGGRRRRGPARALRPHEGGAVGGEGPLGRARRRVRRRRVQAGEDFFEGFRQGRKQR
jgi:nitrite reductase (NADH) large subunit